MTVRVLFESGPHPYRPAIFLSVCVQFESGPHPYRSVIHSSYQVSSTSRSLFQYDIQSHFPHLATLVLIAYSLGSSRFPFSLHMTQFFEFVTHTFVMLLGTLHLAFSYSSPKAVSFERSLFYSPGWFDRYSSLTSIFESLLEISQKEPGSLVWLQRHFETSLSFRIRDLVVHFASLGEFISHQCPYGGLLGSSVEFTSLHSLFTLTFHSSVHVPYTRELYRREAYLQTPFEEPRGIQFFYIYQRSWQHREVWGGPLSMRGTSCKRHHAADC